MHYELNFGPSEHTAEQRQVIADQAIAIIRAEEHEPSAELRRLYGQYVAGETDLYAISMHVSEQPRHPLHPLLGPVAL